MEGRYGKSDRIWVMDRGMVSEDNIEFLREGGRRYIVGTPKSMLKKFEQEILKEDWHSIHDGLEVKIVPWPKSDDDQATSNKTTRHPNAASCAAVVNDQRRKKGSRSVSKRRSKRR